MNKGNVLDCRRCRTIPALFLHAGTRCWSRPRAAAAGSRVSCVCWPEQARKSSPRLTEGRLMPSHSQETQPRCAGPQLQGAQGTASVPTCGHMGAQVCLYVRDTVDTHGTLCVCVKFIHMRTYTARLHTRACICTRVHVPVSVCSDMCVPCSPGVHGRYVSLAHTLTHVSSPIALAHTCAPRPCDIRQVS